MTEYEFDQIGYWSELKLEIVRKYATAYSTILAKQQSINRHVYVDAFAGWGVHVSKASGDFVAGSPTNALNVQPPFSEYHFVDLDHRRVDRLQQISRKRNEVTVYQGDCNEILLNHVFPRCRYQSYARALCLLDPYKLNLNWTILEMAGKMETIEVFYNFMIMDANRNVLWRRPANVPQSQRDRMTAVWGDESWRDAAYTKQPSLFEDIELEDKNSNEEIVAAFRERLQKVAGFKYVPQPLPMKNDTGAVIYYLFFASPNRTGGKIVTEIFDSYRSR